MKNVIAGVVLALVLNGCTDNGITEKSREMVFPNCSNDFFVVFNETTTFTGSDSTINVTLQIQSPKMNRKLELDRTPSASGVKYTSKDRKYILWEHQGEFRFGTEDSTYCLCQ